MKRILSIFSLLAIVALAGQAMAYTVSLSPLTQTVNGLGNTATVNVDVNLEGATLSGFDLFFAFNSSILQLTTFNTLAEIPILPATIVNTDTEYSGLFDNYVGGFTYDPTIDPDVISFNGFAPTTPLTGTGSFTLATLTFTGISYGLSQLNLTGDLDLGNTALDPVDVLGPVTASANVVPEPGTFLLLGIGLAGLVGYRRKFQKN